MIDDGQDDVAGQLADRNQAAKNLRDRQIADLKFVMETVQGRRFVWLQLERAGVFQSSYTGETNSTFFKEGQRNGGLKLFTDVMEACPDLYLKMADEAKEDNKP